MTIENVDDQIGYLLEGTADQTTIAPLAFSLFPDVPAVRDPGWDLDSDETLPTQARAFNVAWDSHGKHHAFRYRWRSEGRLAFFYPAHDGGRLRDLQMQIAQDIKEIVDRVHTDSLWDRPTSTIEHITRGTAFELRGAIRVLPDRRRVVTIPLIVDHDVE